MNKKQKLGQFFTTNVDYILNGFENIISKKDIIDPFAGGGDLLNWAFKNGAKSIKGFDIDIKCLNKSIELNDSLDQIPIIGNFILTNPPYLAKNKMPKNIKNKYLKDNNIDDLYLLAINNIIKSNCQEGIIIVPINFFSAENSDQTRKHFMSIYNIGKINYFTEQVFNDTTYNVVAFHYFKDNSEKRELNINVLPENKKLSFMVEKQFYYRIGGKEIFNIINCKNTLKIKRITEEMINNNPGKHTIDGYYGDFKTKNTFNINKELLNKLKNNIITIECIDGKKENNKICANDMRFSNIGFLVGKNTSRNIASIIIENCDINIQTKLIINFNKKLLELRKKYNSLFLTNFRDNDRKRISFDFCYKLLNYCYLQLNDK